MMAAKASLFKDFVAYEKILISESAAEVKILGRQVSNFDEKIWLENRLDIVLFGNILKFSQNLYLQNFLLSTENKIIVEASPYDRIWGIGLYRTDENSSIISKWEGLNLLGFSLMAVREMVKLQPNEQLISKT